MHALAWCNKSTNEILLSRDHAGLNNYIFLYELSIFSSEIKGLHIFVILIRLMAVTCMHKSIQDKF